MTEHLRRLLLLLCAAEIGACGPSAEEVRMRSLSHELRAEVQEQRQYNDDLKLRLQLATARNRVLVDLVQGLTSDTARARGEGGAPSGLESADTSLHALDSDLSALVASVHHSEQDIAAMQAQQRRARSRAEPRQSSGRGGARRASQGQSPERCVCRRGRVVRGPGRRAQRRAARAGRPRAGRALCRHVVRERRRARAAVGQGALGRRGGVLKQVEGHDFEVAAHTDSRSPRGRRYPDNWRLSADRALQVLLY